MPNEMTGVGWVFSQRMAGTPLPARTSAAAAAKFS
jgi:hypothetical protein